MEEIVKDNMEITEAQNESLETQAENVAEVPAETQAESEADQSKDAEEAANAKESEWIKEAMEAEEIDAPDATEEIDEEKMMAAIESILFAMGSAVEIPRIASTLELDVRKTKALIKKLSEKYESKDSGLMIAQFENAVQLCTKPDLYEYLIKIAKAPRKYVLSESVMETLSIVAYKQPVTKAEIEKIRGVSCEHAINKLVEFDLVEEVGRMDAPGRPLLFGTTEQFLRSFGVQSLEDLPLAGTDAVETFREQAEQEAQLKLDI